MNRASLIDLLIAVRKQAMRDELNWRKGKKIKFCKTRPLTEWKKSRARQIMEALYLEVKDLLEDDKPYKEDNESVKKQQNIPK